MSRAEAQSMTAPRFFVSTWVGHGGISEENAYPIDSTVSLTDHTLTPASGTEPAHVAKAGRLVDLKRTHAAALSARTQDLTDFDAGAARFSPLLGSFVEDSLLAKLNVLRGIDFLTFGGHTRGYLGNFTNRDGGVDNGLAASPVPTIDAVIAASSRFYSTGDRALLKAPVLNGAGPHLSSFPQRHGRLGEFYDLLFGGVNTTPGMQVDPRVSLLDRVNQDYRRLSRGAFGPGRRISTEDRQRFEEYVSGVETISARMRAMVSAGCSLPTVATGQRTLYLREGEADWDWDQAAPMPQQRVADQKTVLELRNQMLVNAFLCGTSRMAVMSFSAIRDQWDPLIFNTPSQSETHRTDAHGMLFHNHVLADRQQHLVASQRFFMQYGFIDLVRRMQATQVLPGVTMLDQALVYCELADTAYSTKFASRGGKVPGYGDPFVEPGDDKVPYPPAMVAAMSDKLPLL